MTTAVYFNGKTTGKPILLAVFLMKSEAETFAKGYGLNEILIKDLPTEAHADFIKIKGYIQ